MHLFQSIFTVAVFFSIAAVSPAQTGEAREIFAKRVQPLLVSKCGTCHGAAKSGGLSVQSRDSLIAGGKHGPAIVPGSAANSYLISALEQSGSLKMPPGQKLADTEISAVRRWIDLGAPWSDTAVTEPTASKSSAADLWAFQPVRHYDPPSIKDAEILTPVDAFIAEKLRAKGIRPAPRADRVTLIRRITFDLTGLPPTPKEVDDFLHDQAPDKRAYAKVVERLLNSEHYGERWGRHWLDVVRYADTGGFSNDFERPHAWRYREYVIRSFNQDKPYDRFIREQIAGDEIDPQDSEALIATGFLRMGPWEHTGMSVAAETRQLWLDDVTHTTATAFLGLTMECARCHDHKFDPLPTRDYYRLQAVFSTTEFAERPAPFLPSEIRPGFSEGRRRMEDLVRRNDARIKSFDDLVQERLEAKNGPASPQALADAIKKRDLLTAEEMERLKVYAKRKELYTRAVTRYDPVAYTVAKGSASPDTFILPVGNLKTPGEKVTPGVLSALLRYASFPSPDIPATATPRRLPLANWIADANNPLTSRVMVNRIWQYHFGKGIAANPNNLGKMGKPPTHPELLDWLADYFVRHNWSVKEMHRVMVLSAAYQRAAAPADKADLNNDLLAHFSPRRLEAEELRDSILAVSGELSADTGGPGTFPEINRDVATQPQQIMGTLMPAYRPSPLKRDRNRRTVYSYQQRNLIDPFLDVFNGPSLDNSTEQRMATIVPTQAFALFNSEFVHDEALAFAERVARMEKDRDAQVRAAYRIALNRAPNEREMSLMRAQLDKMTAYHRRVPPPATPPSGPLVRSITSELTGNEVRIEEDRETIAYEANRTPAEVAPEIRALADVLLAILNSNEFVYLN